MSISRRYRPGTLILETVFDTAGGSAALIDFMAMHGGDATRPPTLIRIVEGRLFGNLIDILYRAMPTAVVSAALKTALLWPVWSSMLM